MKIMTILTQTLLTAHGNMQELINKLPLLPVYVNKKFISSKNIVAYVTVKNSPFHVLLHKTTNALTW